MKSPKSIELVSEFHRTFKHPIKLNVNIPSTERSNLRVSLLSEELDELKEAIENNDIVEIADAFCDLQYVLSGAILEFGLGDKFEDLFNEVHRSNMSKAASNKHDAEETIRYLKENDNVDAYYEEVEGHFLIYRTVDNKVMKSISYSPAKLSSILKEV